LHQGDPYIATGTALRGKRASWAVVLGGVWRVTVGRGGCGRQCPYHAGSELLQEARRGGPRRARQAEAGGRAPRAAGPDRAHARRQQKRDAARSVRHRPALQQHQTRYRRARYVYFNETICAHITKVAAQ
jgi:hypothetical protein